MDILVGEVSEAPEELRRLSGVDSPEIPDDLFVATAATAAASSPAFLEIMDSGCFTAAPCLCCYSVKAAEYMREAASALRLFCGYHSPTAFVAHRSYGRAVALLARDLLPAEVRRIQQWLARLEATPEILRTVHRLEHGICVALPVCQPRTIWVYSTPDGRRLLRHLARSLPRSCGTLSVAVASSSAAALPRFRFRMYAATICADESVLNQQELLLGNVLAWVEKRQAKRQSMPKKVG